MNNQEYRHQWTNDFGVVCQCVLSVFESSHQSPGKTVVVARDEEHQNRIAGEIERIATDICRRFAVSPEDLILIEYHSERYNFEETYDLVELEWNHRLGEFSRPCWSPLSNEATAGLTGSFRR